MNLYIYYLNKKAIVMFDSILQICARGPIPLHNNQIKIQPIIIGLQYSAD